MTSVHFLTQWVVSWSLSTCFPKTLGGDIVKEMTWEQFLKISLPCGLIFAIDIGLSNLSLVLVTLTFYTMVKSSAPIFVLAFAFFFKLERPSWALFFVVITISVGEALTVIGETQFDVGGFFLVLMASASAGLKWTLIQLLLSKLDPPLPTSIASLRVIGPAMTFSMILLSIIIEKPWVQLSPGVSDYFSTFENSLHTVGLTFLGASFAVAMVLAEFSLIMQSSAMILMIGGVLKELITIFLGVTIFKDELVIINEMGIVIIFTGVIMFKIVFHKKDKKEHQVLSDIDDDIWVDETAENEEPISPFVIDDDDDDHDHDFESTHVKMAVKDQNIKNGQYFSSVQTEDDLPIDGHTIT
mmetsp:Transcript_39902/g.93660  ORF Transcript_39902/g.93660 Transcript_39902/m.93660 type:complete len:356 (-) Transcript_39902:185-1252(-)